MERMPKHKRRAVEDDLRKYPYYKNVLEAMRDEIIYSSNHEVKGMPRGGEQTSVTESKAIALVSQTKYNYIDGIVRMIERVYENLREEDKKLIKLRYFDGRLTDEGVMMELNIGYRGGYYAKKNELLQVFGFALGYWYSL